MIDVVGFVDMASIKIPTDAKMADLVGFKWNLIIKLYGYEFWCSFAENVNGILKWVHHGSKLNNFLVSLSGMLINEPDAIEIFKVSHYKVFK